MTNTRLAHNGHGHRNGAANGNGHREIYFHDERLKNAMLEFSEREQRRAGREIHEGLCQELAGIAFLIKAMQRKLQAGQPIAEHAAADVAALMQDAVKHAGALARGLWPVDSLPDGLSAALRHLAADTTHLFAVRCEFRSPGAMEVSDFAAAIHLYRIAQECVRNAIRHAGATNVVIGLARRRGGIELSITDNAERLSSSEIFGGEMVHEMIQHRASAIGGRIVIQRSRDGGTRITCRMPDPAAA